MLWDTTTGDRLKIADHFGTSKIYNSHLQSPEEGNASPYAVAFSADCRQIAAVGWYHDHQVIMLFDTATWDLQKILTAHSDTVLALAFSPDNRQLVSGSFDRTVRLVGYYHR
jgi:FOG: WD40 repeat